MANSISRTRTNYFKVTSEDDFLKLIDDCATDDPQGIEVWTRDDEDGEKRYAFGCEGDFLGLRDGEDEDCDYDYDGFVEELKKLLPDNEAAIITSICYEKLRFVSGDVFVVTNVMHDLVTLHSAGLSLARKLLKDPKWETKCEY